ncbi:MAG: hypothetical protein VX761_03865 [Planctomycetota bacterium]|nr:hypothetical protein [Planctomycetota bacterium]
MAVTGRRADAAQLQGLAEFMLRQSDIYLRGGQDEQKNATEQELKEASRLALVDLCHVLLSSNEFAYID